MAMVGQEYVFRETFENVGVTHQELNQFFSRLTLGLVHVWATSRDLRASINSSSESISRSQESAKKMHDMGITMEGINNNKRLYQLMLDIPWKPAETNTGQNYTTIQ
ncbi:hypothetical protein EDD11_003000 [Mortierella claussenii]|nr:hypothetical protein EDD11_003000 [Mortierella claussenii]